MLFAGVAERRGVLGIRQTPMRTIYLTWGTFAAVTTVALVAVTLTAISTREVREFTIRRLVHPSLDKPWTTTPTAIPPCPRRLFGANPTKPSLPRLPGLMLRR